MPAGTVRGGALRTAGVLLAFALAGGQAAGAGVYKWVDERGRVHYGDRPPADAEAQQRLELRSPAPQAGAPAGDAERRLHQQRLLDAFARERADREAAARAALEARRERRLNCARAEDQLRRLREAGYLYTMGPDGERRVFSDTERALETRRAEAAVEQWCR